MARPNGNCGPWPDPTPQKCVTFSNTRMPQICFREESSADRICSRSRCSPSPAVMASPNSGIPIKAEQDSDGSAQSTADMTAFVQNLLMQMVSSYVGEHHFKKYPLKSVPF
uniref:Uncharacterized protein n=1 Tax=Setaria italica TaxID=4555 RepID=K3Y067_SETIT